MIGGGFSMKKIIRIREIDYYHDVPEEVEITEAEPKKRVMGAAHESFSFFPQKSEKIKAYIDEDEDEDYD